MATHAELAKIHIAAKELGFSEDEYRHLLWDRYHKLSAKNLAPQEVWDLLRHFRSLGWKPLVTKEGRDGRNQNPQEPSSDDPQSRKIRTLWKAMHREGMVQDGSEQALRKFVKRMTGIDALQWCSSREKAMLIESLKKWRQRQLVKEMSG